MLVTKCLISPGIIRIFAQKRQKLGPKLAFLFILGQALPVHLVGWLVVVARGMVLARHLFTLSYLFSKFKIIGWYSIAYSIVYLVYFNKLSGIAC